MTHTFNPSIQGRQKQVDLLWVQGQPVTQRSPVPKKQKREGGGRKGGKKNGIKVDGSEEQGGASKA